MSISNMHEAKTHLSQLVEDAMAGKDVVIAKAGKPLVRLVPIRHEAIERKPGKFKGKVRIAEDFDQTPVELIRAFEGE